jgi:hypothetical protein
MSSAVATPVFAVSDTTQKILKNFSGISNSVLLSEGKRQRTVLQSKAVFAIAEFPEAWPKETGIYDLSMFLGTLSSFDKPTLDFKDDAMVITNADKSSLSVRYRYSDPSTIMAIGDKTFPTNEPAVEFTLTDFALTGVKKMGALLKLATISIAVKDGNVLLVAADPKNSSSHAFKLEVPKSLVTVHDTKFARTIPFKAEHFNLLLEGNYTVSLSSWKYGYFSNNAVPVSYFIVEQTKD